jgi:hypothetical protein
LHTLRKQSLPILISVQSLRSPHHRTYKRFVKIDISRVLRTYRAVCVAIGCILALAGCTSIKVRMGMKVYLAKTPVTSIVVSLPNGPGMAPGEKSPLIVQVTEPGGKVLQTEGAGHGKVLWKDLAITTTVVTANQKGIVSLPHDPRKSEGQVGHVVITVPSHPDVRAEIDIPVRYNYSFTSNFSGSTGSSGMSGSDGMAGSGGSTGSIDPTSPSAGGSGGNGTDGSNGGDGGSGGDAPPVQIRVAIKSVAIKSVSRPLLQVSVSAAGKQKLCLVDPQGGSLTVSADGGPGGAGGRGGRGGAGGSGGMGIPPGSNGLSGADGRNGSDGSPGKGGSVTVTYDPQAKPYLGTIRISNKGGPPPVFKEEPVAALW